MLSLQLQLPLRLHVLSLHTLTLSTLPQTARHTRRLVRLSLLPLAASSTCGSRAVCGATVGDARRGFFSGVRGQRRAPRAALRAQDVCRMSGERVAGMHAIVFLGQHSGGLGDRR